MSNDPVIRITREEATSSHVDDLLKRQQSLMGEPVAKRSQTRSWFYQNWFVFAIVGTLGAAVAWAVMDPYFKDSVYLQGTITEVHFTEAVEAGTATGEHQVRRLLRPSARITIHGQVIWVAGTTRAQERDGTVRSLDPSSLRNGEEVGAWVNWDHSSSGAITYTEFIRKSPPPQAANAETSLQALAQRRGAIGLLLFPTVAAFIGLFVGAADGLVCRLPRRALLAGGVGLLVGFVGGLVSGIIGEIAYSPLSALATREMASDSAGMASFGFGVQVLGRSLAWGLCGIAMGLGQGLALRSGRLIMYGILGGVIGGLLGGLLFDPIDVVMEGRARGGEEGARYSRLVGFLVIGGSVGAMIGLVELLARDAWLRMTHGPLKGKEFLLFKDIMTIGSSPRSDLYLFNDPKVAPEHAVIRAVGENCELEARQAALHPVAVNGIAVTRARLRHGDNVAIGNTIFAFQRRKG